MPAQTTASPTTDVTPLSVALLALLHERDMHPYEMLHTLRDRREDHLVKVRPGSLYHCIERLERDGLAQVCGTECVGNRPERTTYRLTDRGRLALREWVHEHLATVENTYPPLPLALAEAHSLSPQEVRERLTIRLNGLEVQIDELEAGLTQMRERDVLDAYGLAWTHSLAMSRAEHDYITDLITRIDSKDLTWPMH
ncbi:PadR family transcriptional regulator [Leekyejoonella antrihumi]|uniref:PadR family transcriptional regulator n=1 Tax=Leekyejoonella antrihumi TaxID=1660198 RepID=UPI001645C6BC|nr:PadR family transcriptional regulator [Leekyejoonella antrihumi]